MLVSARSFAEYRAMFALTDRDLTGRVLDCPGGAAGFVAEAGRRGVDAVAVDPEYAGERGLLGVRALREVRHKHADLVRDAARYLWSWYGDPGRYTRMRIGAARSFAADLAARPERYVAGSLPRLPFPDRSFDLVLSSHLLFSYGARLDEDFHLAALLELARVARREVRLFPVVQHTTDLRYAPLERLRGVLAERGVPSRLERVRYAFQPGGDEVLVLCCTDHRASAGAAGAPGRGGDPRAGVVDPVRWRHREGATGPDGEGVTSPRRR
ncbi:methyltransferase domain-containing protein [Streptomyces sp. NPDC049906]|uniref:methyltransferase domain-containing protein n=1 Tax=Streptomyces sp. NPDC049906 TaxID=3155656 RepID=UPI003434AEEF